MIVHMLLRTHVQEVSPPAAQPGASKEQPVNVGPPLLYPAPGVLQQLTAHHLKTACQHIGVYAVHDVTDHEASCASVGVDHDVYTVAEAEDGEVCMAACCHSMCGGAAGV